MTEERDPNGVDAFEERLKAWGARPPEILPRAAAAAVVARLSRRPASARALRLAAAAVALAVTLTGILVVRRRSPPATPPADALTSVHPLPDNVVQFWLDAETPVYFVTGPQRPTEGGL